MEEQNAKEKRRVSNSSAFLSNTEILDEKGRKPRDMCACVFLILVWIVNIAIMYRSLGTGNPARLIFGVDYTGNVCGGTTADGKVDNFQERFVEGDNTTTNKNDADAFINPLYIGSNDSTWKEYYKSHSVITFPQIEKDFLVNKQLIEGQKLPYFFGICQQRCPLVGDIVCTLEADFSLCSSFKTETSASACGGENEAQFQVYRKLATAKCALQKTNGTNASAVCKGCWEAKYNTYPVMKRCVPVSSSRSEARCIYPLRQGGQTWIIKTAEDRKFCQFSESITTMKGAAMPQALVSSFNSASKYVNMWMGDLSKTKTPILLCGAVFTIFIGYMWLHFLKLHAGFVVWLTLYLSVLLSITSTLVMLAKAGIIGTASQFASMADHVQNLQNKGESHLNMNVNVDMSSMVPGQLPPVLQASQENVERYKWCGIILAIFTILLLATIISMRRQINVAATIMKEASRALQDMPAVVFFPTITFTLTLLLSVYFIFVATYIASSRQADIENSIATDATALANALPNSLSLAKEKMREWSQTRFNTTTEVEFDFSSPAPRVVYTQAPLTKTMLLFHVLVWLWSQAFISAFGLTVVAGAVCMWYWKKHASGLDRRYCSCSCIVLNCSTM